MSDILGNVDQIGLAQGVTMLSVLMAVGICFVLELIVGFVYMKTFKGVNYSQTFLQTLVIIGLVTCVIIMVIGDNVARAFGLAGALSIIRFRTALDDPRDIVFILFATAIGLACGGGYYLGAVIMAVSISLLIYIMSVTNYGMKNSVHMTLKITIPENVNYGGLFDEILEEYFSDYILLRVRTLDLGTMFQLVYSVKQEDSSRDKEMFDKIRTINGNLPITLSLGKQEFWD